MSRTPPQEAAPAATPSGGAVRRKWFVALERFGNERSQTALATA